MKITNNYDLPAPLVSAIENDPYEKVGDISINGLISPPQMRILKQRHDNEISEDAADGIWKILGQSVHSVLERADTTGHIAEQRMTAQVEGKIISGKPDLYHPQTGKLTDWKVTSVYSFLLGEKPDWEMQLNLYRWLYVQHGFDPKSLEIVAILRDWSRTRSKVEPDYPRVAVMRAEIPLWPIERADAEVRRLVRAHFDAERLKDAELPPCTPEQRWEKPTTFAVKKKDAKRAFRVFESLMQAEEVAAENKMEIETRLGESVRCEDYCPVKQFCAQYAASKSIDKAA